MTKHLFKTYVTILFTASIVIAESEAQEISSLFQNSIQTLMLTGSKKLYEPGLVQKFYEANYYEPAWKSETDGALFLAVLQCATDEGLMPEDYHFFTLRSLYNTPHRSEQEQLQFDVLLTDAFMRYASHLLRGKVSPGKLYNVWEATPRTADFPLLLKKALVEKTISQTIENLIPQHSGYKKLQRALLQFRNLQVKGGFPILPQGTSLEPGMYDTLIDLIRKRLFITGHLPVTYQADSTLYDSALVEAIRNFQQQYGLVADGVIGKNTIAALNLSIDKHIQKIIINMERYRWLPDTLGKKYVMINIPDFHAHVIAHDSIIINMKAIVGRPERKTPVFSSDIHYLIINPTWTVPPTILREDVLPAVKRNINYLKKNNLKIIDRKGIEIDPYTLDWSHYTARNFPYQLRQDPGPANSLGLIKFQFPNNHRVFLHDTNHHGLFATNYRALSSGCIRIEHPFRLANYLLANTSWTEQRLEKIIESGKTITITIPQYIPIHVQYFTAFVNEKNKLQFRNDVYGWDESLYPFFTEYKLP
jgi:L,D-transpeptidase YcbB